MQVGRLILFCLKIFACLLLSKCMTFLRHWLSILCAGIRDCNPSPRGYYYVGNTSVTVNGTPCQAWSSQSPHQHIYSFFSFPDGSASAAHNYCRNPDNSHGLWCYTTDPRKRWERCAVPACGQSLSCMRESLRNKILFLAPKEARSIDFIK